MIGAFLNALGILAGSLAGLTQGPLLSARAQNFFKTALGVFAVLFGLHLIWLSVNGTFLAELKQMLIAALAVVLGNWIGKLLRLQLVSNRVGRHAGNLLNAAQKQTNPRAADGFAAVTILFCAAPLGIVGAITDGLGGYFYLLALKAVMDGLAMMSFVKIFRWPVALVAIPVLVWLDGITMAVHLFAAPYLQANHWMDSVNVTAGLVTCAMALVVFEVRRVELANFLPALAVAPLLTRLLG